TYESELQVSGRRLPQHQVKGFVAKECSGGKWAPFWLMFWRTFSRMLTPCVKGRSDCSCFRCTWLLRAPLGDAQTGQEVRTLQGHTDAVWGVSWSPDSQRRPGRGSPGLGRTDRSGPPGAEGKQGQCLCRELEPRRPAPGATGTGETIRYEYGTAHHPSDERG